MSSLPVSKHVRFVGIAIAILLVLLLFAGCVAPARQDHMAVTVMPAAEARLGTVCITVYGDDVGGFASHYYPLPREDFEAALLESVSTGGAFQPVARDSHPDFLVTVGLVHLVAPQWSGRVTLETSWSVTSAETGEAIARQAIQATTPAPFSKVRDATEAAAQENIAEGLAWLEQVIESYSTS
jgi:hypothetical protein